MTRSKTWRWVWRAINLAFFILVPVLLVLLVRHMDWQEVGHTLRAYKISTLLTGGGIAVLSYLLFASFDLVSRRYTGHTLPATQVMPLAFVCYAFNLNLSSWVGGIALRYRLYGKLGLDVPTVSKILGLGLVTNWLGYLFVGGTVFAMGLPALPADIKLGASGLRLIGVLMLLVGLTYVLACGFSRRRSWTLRRSQVTLPSARVALLQAALGALNWCLMATLIFVLLPAKVGFATVLAILLISSIAGVIAHIPAGLGVLETVFITLLAGQYSQGTLVAALIGYRVLYFLMPLGLACITYLILEKRTRTLQKRHQAEADTASN